MNPGPGGLDPGQQPRLHGGDPRLHPPQLDKHVGGIPPVEVGNVEGGELGDGGIHGPDLFRHHNTEHKFVC